MSDRFSSPPGLSRNTVIAGSVILFHVVALWALQSGLIRKAAEVVIPVEILSELIDPPKPLPPPPPPPPPPPKRELTRTPPPPRPQAVRSPLPPPPNAPTGTTEAPRPPAPIAPPEPPSPPAPPAPPPAPPAPPTPAHVEPPVLDADYAPNAGLFVRSAMSIRMGEFGRVVLSVTVEPNGYASQVRVIKSSGYPRLDESAMQGAKRLKFRPATRAGLPISNAYELPVNFKEPQ